MTDKLPVIALRLAGGLGNQIFQVMAALLLSQRTGQSVWALPGDLNSYRTARTPDVLRLLSALQLNSSTQVTPGPLTRWLSVRARAGRWLPLAGLGDKAFPHAVEEPHRRLHPNFLDGYFQRGWTSPLLNQARAGVKISDVAGALQRAGRHDCLLHIRGGDFLQYRSHAFIDAGYYDRCLRLARDAGCRTFGIVTDDPAYAGHVAADLSGRHTGLTLELLPATSGPLEDFATLRHARHRIIGNSTFAWWASALDDSRAPTWSPDKFVRDIRRDFFLPHERTVASETN